MNLNEPAAEPDDNRCEHLTFVTCQTCGLTYDQRIERAREESS